MNILTIIDHLILIMGIGFCLMVLSNTVIRGIGEEKRKTAETSLKILDRYFDKLINVIETGFKGLKSLDDTPKVDYTSYTSFTKEDKKE